jgi:hypothetical protein
MKNLLALLLLSGLALAAQGQATPQTVDWTILLGEDAKSLEAWKNPSKDWIVAGDVMLDPENPKRLSTKPGTGVFVNGPKGRLPDLLTKENYGDIEVHLEFNIPKGSNSGIKFCGLYEIQILDSFGVKKLKGSDCGGIYPKAELKPKYKYLDDGIPPRTNACKPPGEWQTLEAIFVAPRFGPDGKKTANARIVKAMLNGELIHDDVELLHPTGANWTKMEIAKGPILLQADHGPVAFRNVRVRPYVAKGNDQQDREPKDGEQLLAAIAEGNVQQDREPKDGEKLLSAILALQQFAAEGYGADHPKCRKVVALIDKLRLAGVKVDRELAAEKYLEITLESKQRELEGCGPDHPKCVALRKQLNALKKEGVSLDSELAQQELVKLVGRAAELLEDHGPMHPQVRANYALIAHLAEMLATPPKK